MNMIHQYAFFQKHNVKNTSERNIPLKILVSLIWTNLLMVVSNHKRKFLFLIKYDFKLVFNDDFSKTVYIETNIHHKTTLNNLKRYFHYKIDNFVEKRCIFSHVDEINYHNHRPMPAIELNLNMIIAENPNLIKSPNRSPVNSKIFSH